MIKRYQALGTKRLLWTGLVFCTLLGHAHAQAMLDAITGPLDTTGFGAHWPNREKYLGTNETGRPAVAKLHFPGLDAAAADWLITRRQIRAVGIDTASIDHGQTQDYPTHVRLFRDSVPALENVADLDKLPANRFGVDKPAIGIELSGERHRPGRGHVDAPLLSSALQVAQHGLLVRIGHVRPSAG